MPANECLDFLVTYLERQEEQAYERSLQLWATLTANASPEDREKCRPKKPEHLQNRFGE